MARIPFDQVHQDLLKQPQYRKAFEALGPKYEMIATLIRARLEEGLTQKELAKRMKTSQSAIARLEGGEVPPTSDTIIRYAAALGRKPVLELVKGV